MRIEIELIDEDHEDFIPGCGPIYLAECGGVQARGSSPREAVDELWVVLYDLELVDDEGFPSEE